MKVFIEGIEYVLNFKIKEINFESRKFLMTDKKKIYDRNKMFEYEVGKEVMNGEGRIIKILDGIRMKEYIEIEINKLKKVRKVNNESESVAVRAYNLINEFIEGGKGDINKLVEVFSDVEDSGERILWSSNRFPILVKKDSNQYEKERFWQNEFLIIDGVEYSFSNDWYEKNLGPLDNFLRVCSN